MRIPVTDWSPPGGMIPGGGSVGGRRLVGRCGHDMTAGADTGGLAAVRTGLVRGLVRAERGAETEINGSVRIPR